MKLPIPLTALLLTLLAATMLFPTVEADIGPKQPDPPESSGLGTEQTNISTYLRYVDVHIQVHDHKALCNGSFVLSNPSNGSESLELYFDPGVPVHNPSVQVDGNKTDYIIEDLGRTTSNFWARDVVSFTLPIMEQSEARVELSWEMETSTSWHGQIGPLPFGNKGKNWEISYLIIATSAWDHNIEDVNLTFDIRSQHFQDYDILYRSIAEEYESLEYHDVEPTLVTTNEEGLAMINFHFQNFSKPSLYILVQGDEELDRTECWGLCGAFIILGALVIVTLTRPKRGPFIPPYYQQPPRFSYSELGLMETKRKEAVDRQKVLQDPEKTRPPEP